MYPRISISGTLALILLMITVAFAATNPSSSMREGGEFFKFKNKFIIPTRKNFNDRRGRNYYWWLSENKEKGAIIFYHQFKSRFEKQLNNQFDIRFKNQFNNQFESQFINQFKNQYNNNNNTNNNIIIY